MPDIHQLRFEWLAKQFEALVDDLNLTNDARERQELLRRMRIIITEVDALILREHPDVI